MFDFLFLLLGLTSAQAQTCPTRPTGDNSNACASTAFVKNQNYLPNIGWTNGLPLIGSPTGTVTQGTISGTTTKFPVVDGTTTGGQCAVWDSNGGLTSVNCSPPGSGTVGSGTVGQLAIYTDSTAVAGTSTGVITVANIAALKALVGGIATSVNVQGYYTVDDGGEGIFNWNGSSSATDDAGIIIAPTSGSGRWIRQTYPGKPNVAWWGAKCDWSGAKTDNTPMIQAAVNWLQSSSAGGSVTAPRGCNMAIHDTVVVNGSSIVIEGAAPAADALGSNWQSAWNIHWAIFWRHFKYDALE